MLMSFSLENYRSFRDRQTLNLLRRGRARESARTAAVYGANGAGKSNIVKAISDARSIVTDPDFTMKVPVYSKTEDAGREGNDTVTSFEFEFRTKSGAYRYTLRISSGKRNGPSGFSIISESAYDITLAKKPIMIFSVDNVNGGAKVRALMEADKLRQEYSRLKSKISSVSENLVMCRQALDERILRNEQPKTKRRGNSGTAKQEPHEYAISTEDLENIVKNSESVLNDLKDSANAIDGKLSELEAMYGNLEHTSILYRCANEQKLEIPYKNWLKARDMFEWFSNVLIILRPDDRGDLKIPGSLVPQLSRIMQSYDVGLSGIGFRMVEPDKQNSILSLFAPQSKTKMDEFRDLSKQDIETSWVFTRESGLYQLSFWHGRRTLREIVAVHPGDPRGFPLGDEPQTVRRLLYLSQALVDDDLERVYVIDELDRSLHPVLTLHFVREFNRLNNSNKQLLFTTNEPALLKDELKPKDVWTVELTGNGSEIASVANNKDVKGSKKRLDRLYLEGKMGGTPKFDN